MTLGLATPADHDDDVELVRALADDDRRAPAALWRRYAPTVFNILRRPPVVAVDEQPPALPIRQLETKTNSEALDTRLYILS
jgi:hypothetical protein